MTVSSPPFLQRHTATDIPYLAVLVPLTRSQGSYYSFPYCKVRFSTENYTGYSYRHGNIGILKFNWTKIALHKPPNYPSFIVPVSVPMASDSREITLDSFLFLETCNSVFTCMISLCGAQCSETINKNCQFWIKFVDLACKYWH